MIIEEQLQLSLPHHSTRQISADLVALSHMLRGPCYQGLQKILTRNPLRVLNMACGNFKELPILLSLILDQGIEQHRVTIVASDLREQCVRSAALQLKSFTASAADINPLHLQTAFISGHGPTVLQSGAAEPPFDLIVFRHQNYWDSPVTWQHMFAQAVGLLAGNGIILLTSYFVREHTLALEAFEKQGASLLSSFQNPFSRRLKTPGKWIDGWIALLGNRSKA